MTRKPAAAPESHDLPLPHIPAISEMLAADWERCAGGRECPGLLVAPGQGAGVTEAALAQGLIALCKLREASSVHATFMTQAEWNLFGTRGFLLRNDQQFHWENGGFSCFDDFLAALASRKRK